MVLAEQVLRPSLADPYDSLDFDVLTFSCDSKLYDDSPFVSQENLDESYVPTYDWVSHLTSVCHKLKAVKSYNHFRFTKSDDVFCKKTIDSEEVKQ